jgi:dipeptidyl-peptidase 4
MLIRGSLLLIFVAVCGGGSARAQDGPHPGFLRMLAETREFRLGRPTGIKPTADGRAVLFLRAGAREPTLALHEFDAVTGETRTLLTPAQLLQGAEEKLSVEEKARRERLRIVDRGFTGFDLSNDGRRILVTLSGRPYVYHRQGSPVGPGGQAGQGGRVQPLGGSDPPAVDARFSPDGEWAAYVRGHDLFVAEVASGKERALTRGGSADLTHGLAEFIAQEEMSRFEGYFWSPDSRRLAYTEVDQRGLERFTIADATRPEVPASTFAYPRAGKANARVRLGLIPLGGVATTWVRWDSEKYPYLARVLWKEKNAPLSLLVQTRDQREQVLLAVDPASGRTRPVHTETDEAWVELDAETPRWLPDGKGLLVASERSGRRALELRRADGRFEREVFPGALGFHNLLHVDPDGAVAYALAATPITTRLYRVPLVPPGPPVPLTGDAAEHNPLFAKNGTLYVDTRTAADALATSTVYRREKDRWIQVGLLPSVAETPPFRVNLQLLTVTPPSGRLFHAAVVRPRGFRPGGKYPVVVNVYGGPTSLMVRSDESRYLLPQWIADHGVVVVAIDNRGTPRRDRAWSRIIKGNFARIPLDDQVEGLRALAARLPELDLNRVGIYGWSFGGYMAALAALKRPDVFRVAVAGAPVVDWRDYDTHYTERYLGVPEKNPAGYDESNLLTHAGGLTRPLLLIHGTTDDNVYFFHSLKLASALFRAGKDFEFLPLTVSHQVPDPVVRERLWGRLVGFLLGALGAGKS